MLLIFPLSLSAQKKHWGYVGIDAHLEEVKNYTPFLYGGAISGNYRFSKNVYTGVSFGFTNFKEENLAIFPVDFRLSVLTHKDEDNAALLFLANVGYSIYSDENYFGNTYTKGSGGLHFYGGIGAVIPKSKILVSAGYSRYEFNATTYSPAPIKDNYCVEAVTFKVGVFLR